MKVITSAMKRRMTGMIQCQRNFSNNLRIASKTSFGQRPLMVNNGIRCLSTHPDKSVISFKIPSGYHVEPLYAEDSYKDIDIYKELEKFMRQFILNVKPAEFGKLATEEDIQFMLEFEFQVAFKDNVSTLIWYNGKTNTTERSPSTSHPDRKLVAMCLSSIRNNDTYEKELEELLRSKETPPNIRIFFQLMKQAHGPVNPHLLFGQSKILYLEMLSVDAEHYRKGLGLKVVAESIRRAWKLQGVNSVLGDAANDLSANLNAKLGMQDLFRLEYKDFVSESGDCIYKHVKGALRHMGRVIKSDLSGDPLKRFLLEET